MDTAARCKVVKKTCGRTSGRTSGTGMRESSLHEPGRRVRGRLQQPHEYGPDGWLLVGQRAPAGGVEGLLLTASGSGLGQQVNVRARPCGAGQLGPGGAPRALGAGLLRHGTANKTPRAALLCARGGALECALTENCWFRSYRGTAEAADYTEPAGADSLGKLWKLTCLTTVDSLHRHSGLHASVRGRVRRGVSGVSGVSGYVYKFGFTAKLSVLVHGVRVWRGGLVL